MTDDPISDHTVRDALRRVRYAQSLRSSPLLNVAAVTLWLRDAGAADTPASRAWALQSVLVDATARAAERLRDVTQVRATAGGSSSDLARLAADFQGDNEDLEAFSLIGFRYLSSQRMSMDELADALGVAYRTIARRLNLGHQLLAHVLRDGDAACRERLGSIAGAPVADRITVVHTGAPGTPPPSEDHRDADDAHYPSPLRELGEASSSMADLLVAVRSDTAAIQLTMAQALSISRHVPTNLTQYMLARVAAWASPNASLDHRFVRLSLWLDQGEHAIAGRWAEAKHVVHDLYAAFEALTTPAFVVLGPPGSGKSTLLRRIEFDAACAVLRDASPVVPISVDLSTYRPPEGGSPSDRPLAWLGAWWHARYPALPSFEAMAAEGRVLLLADGLNETPYESNTERHATVVSWKGALRTLVERGNLMAFSCRSLDYSTPLSSPGLRVPHVQIEPLSDELIEAFLAAHCPAEAADLMAALRSADALDVVRRPFFLQLLAEQADRGAMPSFGRSGIITGFIRAALVREIARDNAHLAPDTTLSGRDHARVARAHGWRSAWDLPSEGPLFRALARLAHRMLCSGEERGRTGSRMRYAAALDAVTGPTARTVLQAGADLGVLTEDRDRDEVLFSHQLFQEYFAGRCLAETPEPERVGHPWRDGEVHPSISVVLAGLATADPLPPAGGTGWEEATILAVTMSDDPSAYAEGLMDHRLDLAGRCAADPDIAPRLAPAIVERITTSLVARSRSAAADLRFRIAAANILGQLDDPRWLRRVGVDATYLEPPLIPIVGGAYPLGRYDLAQGNALPSRSVSLGPYRIGQYPVTNREWSSFMAASGYEDLRCWVTPAAQRWRDGKGVADGARWNARTWRQRFLETPAMLDDMARTGRMPAPVVEEWHERLALGEDAFERYLRSTFPDGPRRQPTLWDHAEFNAPSQPVVGITWYEAAAYCRWLRIQSGTPFRLPTESEWEAAARGREGRAYPYGDTYVGSAGNTVDAHIRRTSPVGVFVEGDTQDGIADLSGNVWEWTDALFDPGSSRSAAGDPARATDDDADAAASSAALRVARGGSWLNDAQLARATYRYPFHPAHANYLYGFRVAADTE